MWKNIVEPGGPQMMAIWRMRIACWITKSTNTHSEYVILIVFLRQQWLRERGSMLRLYVRILWEHWREKYFFTRDFGFHCGVNDILALLGSYAAYIGMLATFRDNLSVPYSGIKTADATDRLHRNVASNLPIYAM